MTNLKETRTREQKMTRANNVTKRIEYGKGDGKRKTMHNSEEEKALPGKNMGQYARMYRYLYYMNG